MATARVTYHNSRKSVTKTYKHGNISQHFEAEARSHLSEDKLYEAAKELRKEYGNLAREMFIATLKGCRDLINNSGVEAVYDATDFGSNTSVPRRPKGGQVSRRSRRNLFARRGSIKVDKTHTSEIKKIQMKGRDLPTKVSVSFKTQWKKLSMEYALRSPPSEVFFKKRDREDVSARLDFINKINEAIRRAEGSIIYSSEKPSNIRKISPDVFSFNFTILYPQIQAPYDFIRKSFVTGAKGSQLDFKTGDKPSEHSSEPLLGAYNRNGILLAERMRPFLRLYAVQMGRELKRILLNKKG